MYLFGHNSSFSDYLFVLVTDYTLRKRHVSEWKKVLLLWQVGLIANSLSSCIFWHISVPLRVGFSSSVPLRVGFSYTNVCQSYQRGYGFSRVESPGRGATPIVWLTWYHCQCEKPTFFTARKVSAVSAQWWIGLLIFSIRRKK